MSHLRLLNYLLQTTFSIRTQRLASFSQSEPASRLRRWQRQGWPVLLPLLIASEH